MKTYSAKPTDVERKWYVLDAGKLTLGRLSTQVAKLLMGKEKPMFTKHIDCGDYVIVINSDRLKVTGKKMDDKVYYKHSGYPGGLKELSLKEKMEKDSTDVIVRAVRGMLPDNKLRNPRLARLKVYKDENHGHSAQKPETFELEKS
ncbi:MAG TPA: 50S ribosomal protein L13 [Candidatus Saccharimonadales bacterium]|nr:50S ribosomal protein L13 [Candidatus Saccharimonadales bacterium]